MSSSFVVRVGKTYVTFVVANALSNTILYPGKKLDYGALNPYLGYETKSAWWGTRLEHVIGIALPLAVVDHTSIALWNKVLLKRVGYAAGTTLSFHAAPAAMLVHGFTFALTGIMIYVAADAFLNPAHKGKEWEAITSKLYPEIRGCHTMWLLPVINAVGGALFKNPAFGAHGTVTGLVGPTTAFTTVKGHSMSWPWEANLTAYEKELNAAPSKAAAAAAALQPMVASAAGVQKLDAKPAQLK